MKGPYKIGTLARLTGFSPALLRAWERRFHLIEPTRGSGGQRLYGDEDLTLLRGVRALIDQGRAIGEIARVDRSHLIAGASPPGGASAATAPAWRQRVVAAALALDGRALSGALDQAFAVMSADQAVADVIEPAAVEIGDLWEQGLCSVASEHLASDQFLTRLGRLLELAQPPGPNAPRVVAACFPSEQHQLGLRIVAWHLARLGVRVIYLGSSMPQDDLARASRKERPQAVLLSVTRRATFTRHRRDVVQAFPASSVGHVFIGGQGVPAGPSTSNHRVVHLRDLPAASAARRILEAIGR